MKKLVSILLLFLQQVCCGQNTTFEQLDQALASSPKPVVILIHTDLCMYCRLEEHVIRRFAELNALLTDSFYFLKLNAEIQDSIRFNDTMYYSNSMDKLHALAEKLGSINNVLTYPTWVLLDSHLRKAFTFPGFLTKDQLLTILKEFRQTVR